MITTEQLAVLAGGFAFCVMACMVNWEDDSEKGSEPKQEFTLHVDHLKRVNKKARAK